MIDIFEKGLRVPININLHIKSVLVPKIVS